MKRLFIILLMIVLICSISYAQEFEGNLVFGGFRYDDALLLSAGFAQNLDAGLWTFEYVDLGHYSVVSFEAAYMFQVVPDFYAGPIAGPNSDWFNTPGDGIDPLNYISGAGGLLTAYKFSSFGLWGYGKYKFSLSKDDQYIDGYSYGIGLFYQW